MPIESRKHYHTEFRKYYLCDICQRLIINSDLRLVGEGWVCGKCETKYTRKIQTNNSQERQDYLDTLAAEYGSITYTLAILMGSGEDYGELVTTLKELRGKDIC